MRLTIYVFQLNRVYVVKIYHSYLKHVLHKRMNHKHKKYFLKISNIAMDWSRRFADIRCHCFEIIVL